MRTLGLIPARGGSKGIPRKNLHPFRGRPLLRWSCDAARRSARLSLAAVSTEDGEIAAVARECGVRVIDRPADLARDETPTLPVVLHALEALGRDGLSFDAVCLLQPTNPLRSPEDIDAAIALLESAGADSVVSVRPVPAHFHPFWTYLVRPDGCLRQAAGDRLVPRRQELPPAFHRDGSVYVTRASVLLSRRSLYGDRIVPYLIPGERSGGIDTLAELRELEARA